MSHRQSGFLLSRGDAAAGSMPLPVLLVDGIPITSNLSNAD